MQTAMCSGPRAGLKPVLRRTFVFAARSTRIGAISFKDTVTALVSLISRIVITIILRGNMLRNVLLERVLRNADLLGERIRGRRAVVEKWKRYYGSKI
jgi:hypothetical protein